MWVSKTIGANKDLSIQSGDYMTGVLTFTKDNLAYSLAGVTSAFKIFSPGNAIPILILTDGNGYAQAGNTITFNAHITLPTGMYRYELFFDFADIGLTDGVMMDGAYWVRKKDVLDNSTTSLIISEQQINVAVAITITQNIIQNSTRTIITQLGVGTDADIVAQPGQAYFLPDGILTQNRNINTSALNVDGDYLELFNQEMGFRWNIVGSPVYYSTGEIMDSVPAQLNVCIRFFENKLRIIN
jgi:hypothetical protein